MEPVFTDKSMWHNFLSSLTRWIGTPYKHWGMIKGKGADCGLFVASCLQEICILPEIDFKRQDRFWHQFTNNEVILDIIKNVSLFENFKIKKVETITPIKGDILGFKIRSKLTNHIGVYIGNDFIINSVNLRGVCVMPLSTIYKNRISSIHRIYKCRQQ
jgi:cell wall-associated NlpC family hydrolase